MFLSVLRIRAVISLYMPMRMQIYKKLNSIDVVILCGGMGRRLRSVVSDRPKPMVVINQKPFLDILIEEGKSEVLRNMEGENLSKQKTRLLSDALDAIEHDSSSNELG